MKYSEFKREVEKLGCEVCNTSGDIVVKRNTYTILAVNKNKEFEFDNVWNNWSRIGEIKSPLFDLAYQLAKTPLVEREEEKKYRVKFPSITRWGDAVYLKKDTVAKIQSELIGVLKILSFMENQSTISSQNKKSKTLTNATSYLQRK